MLQADLKAAQQQIEALGRPLVELRTQFSAELDRMREQVSVAQERASTSERRVLREIDQECTLRQNGEQAVADA